MPLDIYIARNHEDKKFLDSVDIENSSQWNSLWDELEKVGKIFVDPYGTTRLYHIHILKLLKILNGDFRNEHIFFKLKKILGNIKLEKEDIIILEGD